IEVAVKISLQQIRRMIARLPRPPATTGMLEPEFLKIESADIGLDRPNRIILCDIILHTRWQKAQLLSAWADFIDAIRHHPNRISIQKSGDKNSCPVSSLHPSYALKVAWRSTMNVLLM